MSKHVIGRPFLRLNQRPRSQRRAITTSIMKNEDEKVIKSSAPLSQSFNLTSSSSTQQQGSPDVADGLTLQNMGTTIDQETEPAPQKSNWIVTWVYNQIKTFNPVLLLMGIKYWPLITPVTLVEALSRQ